MNRIGIDAGGSLIKLAYEEAGRLHVKTYDYTEKDRLSQWLQLLTPQAAVNGTGGKWNDVAASLKLNTQSIDEFPAIVSGTNYLLEETNQRLNEYILVSIGTGTSIFHVEQDSFERLLGSGIGGGTWLGLGSLIAKGKTFRELVELSATGDHENSDLLVKDIYQMDDAPLTGELTAANFGKAHLPGDKSEADHLQALTQLIGEVIVSLAGTVAASKTINHIVFVGSTLRGNQPLRDVLSSFQEMFSYKPIFLEKGAYAGAIGALLH